MSMKYIVKCVNMFTNVMSMYEFDNEDEAKAKIRELKDTGSNYYLIKLYQTVIEPV